MFSVKKMMFLLALLLVTLLPMMAARPTYAQEGVGEEVKGGEETTVMLLPDGATEVADGTDASIDAPLAEVSTESLSCYGGARALRVLRLPATSSGVAGLAWGPHVTTSRCADINFKSQRTVQARAILLSTGRPCAAGWVTVYGNASNWSVLCRGVRDGTRFNIQLRSSATLTNFYVWSAH